MKRFATRSPSYHAGPNMTPLVDVVMVILIFLMLAGSFNSSERALQSKSPLVGIGPTLPNPPDGAVTRLDVYLRPTADGGFAARVGGAAETGDLRTLFGTLDAASRQHAHAGLAPESVQVILRPTTLARWDAVAGVYDATLRAGFTKITLGHAR